MNCGCQTSVVALIFLCNFPNYIFPWKQFVIRRPLNGKHIIFLKGHRVTHKPPTAPINKMASFSAAFGVLDSEGGLLLNFKRRFRARVMTVLKDKLQSEWNKISEAPWVWWSRLFGPMLAEWRVHCCHSDDDEGFRAATQDAQLLHQLDTKYDGHLKSHVRPIASLYFLSRALVKQLWTFNHPINHVNLQEKKNV